jgi:hypothetical protein
LAEEFRALVALLVEMRATATKYKGNGEPLAFYWNGRDGLKVRSVEHRNGLLSKEDLAMF